MLIVMLMNLSLFQLISIHDENMNATIPANMNMVKCSQLLNMEIDKEIDSHKSASMANECLVITDLHSVQILCSFKNNYLAKKNDIILCM